MAGASSIADDLCMSMQMVARAASARRTDLKAPSSN
jgi:hypothetical protein